MVSDKTWQPSNYRQHTVHGKCVLTNINLFSAEKVMATQKRPLTKPSCPPQPPGHDIRVGLLHLKNGQRKKPLQAFPQVGELPAVAGKRPTMENKKRYDLM